MIAITSERPLISFCLFAYNQERFIREAVEGAFAQTYSPLEIILSDDCSPDHTYEIMQEMAAAYRGPHKLILNRNAENLGIGAHVNKLFSLARGRLFVMAAGDDISLPERVQKIVEAWELTDWEALHFCSGALVMDEAGRQTGNHCLRQNRPVGLGEHVRHFSSGILGAAAAYSPKLFKAFGPLPDGVVYEDRAMAFRGRILKQDIIYIEQPLIKYRSHQTNVCNNLFSPGDRKAALTQEKRMYAQQGVLLASFILDLHQAKQQGFLSEREYFRLFASVSFASLEISAMGTRNPLMVALFRPSHFCIRLWAWFNAKVR